MEGCRRHPISFAEQLLAIRDLSDAIAPWFSEGAIDNLRSTFLGLKRRPRELTAFETEAFFTFTRAERQLIEDRRRAELVLGLALQIGFLRMSGRLLDAVPMIPPALWRHLGTQFAVSVPDLGDGYYSELASYVVGPTGHVLLLNNAAFENFSDNGWVARLANHRLPNVEQRTVDLEKMGLEKESLDAVLLVKVYHDLYWPGPDGSWPKFTPSIVLDQIVAALKPGGVLLLVDHSAKPGTGQTQAGVLHRIDEQFARKDFESRGLAPIAESTLLRNPADGRDQVSYKGPMVGKTDRFVIVFRKGNSPGPKTAH